MAASFIEIESEAHAAIARTGQVHVAISRTRVVREIAALATETADMTGRLVDMVTAADFSRVSDDELRHLVALLRELHGKTQAVFASNLQQAGATDYQRALERMNGDVARLADLADELEMDLDPQLREKIGTAIRDLKPASGTNWRAALEALRR